MATTRSTNLTSEDVTDSTAPLLESSIEERNRRFIRRQSLRMAAGLLRRASSRQMLREPSMMVRETAAEQLEERQSDWAYSKPVVILDGIWNFAFIVVATAVLIQSRYETPSMPLRLWLLGYAMQCVLHIICVWIEYRRRQQSRQYLPVNSLAEGGNGSEENLAISPSGDLEDGLHVAELHQSEEGTSVAKHLESANTMFSFIWWIIGFYWISAGGQAMARQSPQLYWLCVIFLAFDVFFVVFCVALACVIAIAVCCCLPCIIAILYAVADQEGASNEDIEQLSKYKFRRMVDTEKLNGEMQGGPAGGVMTECGTDSPKELVLSYEDAECCICLSAYEDGVELRELFCGHHFHCACVDKWLYINATCPLCKYNILKSSCHGSEEV